MYKKPFKPMNALDTIFKWHQDSKEYRWERVPREEWDLLDVWNWFYQSMSAKGYSEVPQFLDKKGQGQLVALHTKALKGDGSKGYEIPVIISILEEVIRYYPLLKREMQWEGPLTPGVLLGFWSSLDFKLLQKKGEFARMARGDGFDTEEEIHSRYFDEVVEDDCVAFEDIEEGEEEEEPTTPSGIIVLDPKTMGRKKRVTVNNWQERPEEKWTESTVWSMMYDRLTDKQIGVRKLNPKSRVKLKELMQEQVREEVIGVARAVSLEFTRFEERFNWYRPFAPGTFCGFYPGIRKYTDANYPHMIQKKRHFV